MSKYDTTIRRLLGPEPADVGEWMSVTKPADLARAERYVEAMRTDPALLEVADAGDKLSKDQTKHDIDHWIAVLTVGMSLLAEYEKLFPGKIDEWTKRVVLPAALFFHDSGRAIDVNQHAVAGARLAYIYFTRLRFPPSVVQRICRIIALHRSANVLKREFDDPAHAIVVVADKCVGDEDRVRPLQANLLRVLSFFGLAHKNWWTEAEHDRVNFAIKSAELIVDSNEFRTGTGTGSGDAGELVLKIVLRTGIAPAREVTTLYAERFHACGRAAQYLGFMFRIEFNGVRYAWDKRTRDWQPVMKIEVPVPSTPARNAETKEAATRRQEEAEAARIEELRKKPIAFTYCPNCAAKLEKREIDGKTKLACPVCKFVHYNNPRAIAVVLVGDPDGSGRILLVRRTIPPQIGFFALPGGNVDEGEGIEEAAVREVKEETGLDIRLDKYVRAVPIKEANQNLVFYTATVIGGTLASSKETEDVGFYSPEALPGEIAFPTHAAAIQNWTKEKQRA